MQKLVQSSLPKTKKMKLLLTGNRIPKDFFITSGVGESDITIHAGSYHLALKDAGIEMCNIMEYSSILPAIAKEIEKPKNLVHGSVLESIMAVSHAEKGKRATAGLIFGWLFDKVTGKKYGGIVAEYRGNATEEEAKKTLKASLEELYKNGFSERFELKHIRTFVRSFIPKKKYGTALVALCFVNYVFPIKAIS